MFGCSRRTLVATKSAAKKPGKKKRWTSGTFRSCSECQSTEHNIRTCPKKKGAAKKKAKKAK